MEAHEKNEWWPMNRIVLVTVVCVGVAVLSNCTDTGGSYGSRYDGMSAGVRLTQDVEIARMGRQITDMERRVAALERKLGDSPVGVKAGMDHLMQRIVLLEQAVHLKPE